MLSLLYTTDRFSIGLEYHVMLFYVILYYIILYYIIIYDILYYMILYNIILYYLILCYVMLYYTIFYFVIYITALKALQWFQFSDTITFYIYQYEYLCYGRSFVYIFLSYSNPRLFFYLVIIQGPTGDVGDVGQKGFPVC